MLFQTEQEQVLILARRGAAGAAPWSLLRYRRRRRGRGTHVGRYWSASSGSIESSPSGRPWFFRTNVQIFIGLDDLVGKLPQFAVEQLLAVFADVDELPQDRRLVRPG